MATRFIHRGANAAVSRTGNHAGLGVDSDDNRLYVNATGTRQPINVGGVSTLAAASTLTAEQSGVTFFLNLAGGFTTTLPAPAAGLKYRFVVKTAPTTAYVIVTNGGADIMIGGINELEVDTGDDGPYDDDADTLNFAANVAAVGDFVEFISDGTSWYFHGQTKLDGGVTTSTT